MDKITINKEQFEKWWNGAYEFSWQSLCEATKEPRILYAYSFGHEIRFSESEIALGQSYTRCPKFDLTFKEGGE